MLNPFAAMVIVVVESLFLDHGTFFVVEFHRVNAITTRVYLESHFPDCEVLKVDRGLPGPVVSVFTHDLWALYIVGKLHFERQDLAAIMQLNPLNLAQLDLLF